MKIFLSHASANKDYGNALVELLRGLGIGEDQIIFSSNTAYGIPTGQNIFNWLKLQITEKPFVIYLLSKEYYSSIACLNEMGAAWVIENKHVILLTPDFDYDSKEFRSGAIDPREMAFRLNDEERVISFIHSLESDFTISKNHVIINQSVKKYLHQVSQIIQESNKSFPSPAVQKVILQKPQVERVEITKPIQKNISQPQPEGLYGKFVAEVTTDKLSDEELILINYMADTSKTNLFIGWQEHIEVSNIQDWEDIHELGHGLSRNYASTIRKFGLRGYTEVSAVTASNNPKEVKLKKDLEVKLLYLTDEVLKQIDHAVARSKETLKIDDDENDDLPF